MKQEVVKKRCDELNAQSLLRPDDERLAEAAKAMGHVSKLLQTRIDKRKEQHKPIQTVTINPKEPDAVIQPSKKGKASVPSYKPSILANDARIVVALEVHPSSETESLGFMLDRANEVGLENVQEVLLDGGYECIEVLKDSITRDLSILCASGKEVKKKSRASTQD
jgi:sarcosine oxidase delta subunit